MTLVHCNVSLFMRSSGSKGDGKEDPICYKTRFKERVAVFSDQLDFMSSPTTMEFLFVFECLTTDNTNTKDLL